MRSRRVLLGVAVVGLAVALMLWPREEEPEHAMRTEPAAQIVQTAPTAPKEPLRPVVTSSPTPTAHGRFEGVVVDTDDAPVANAELTFGEGSETVRVKTDLSGQFSVELHEGDWQLVITAVGHLDHFDSTRYVPAAGKVVQGLRFVLEPSRLVKGVVLDEEGAPLPNAVVDLGGAFEEDDTLSGVELTRTDDAGRFRAQLGLKLKPYERVLEVSHDCCAPHREPLREGVEDIEVTVRLRRVSITLTTFQGIVVDEHNRPFAGSHVTSTGWVDVDGGRIFRQADAVADQRGAFALYLPGDTVRVYAFAKMQTGSAQLRRGELGKVVITLASGSVSGRVTDETSKPVSNFRVELESPSGAYEGSAQQLSADGRFRLVGLTAGPKQLKIISEDFAKAPPRKFTLERGENLKGLDFVLSRGRSLRGTVTDERTGVGLADAGVWGGGKSTETDALGQFVLEALPFTAVVVEARHGDGYAARSIQVPPGEAGPVTIPLRVLAEEDGGYHMDFEGIGAWFDSNPDGGDTYLVDRVMDGSGASAAGIQAGDEVLSADGAQAAALEYDEFITHVRGPAASTVKLTIRRDGREFDVRVTRKRLTF